MSDPNATLADSRKGQRILRRRREPRGTANADPVRQIVRAVLGDAAADAPAAEVEAAFLELSH
jgi:hypothetical protein